VAGGSAVVAGRSEIARAPEFRGDLALIQLYCIGGGGTRPLASGTTPCAITD
jgi:hypothetical protein